MGRPSKAALLAGRGGEKSKQAAALPWCREECLVLLRAIFGPDYGAHVPDLLGKRLEFVAGTAPGRSRAAHLQALASWLAAPGPGGAPRKAALGYLSVNLPVEGTVAANIDAEAAALRGVLEALQGAQRLVSLELRMADVERAYGAEVFHGTILQGELFELPVLHELVLDAFSYGVSLTGSLAHLGCLTRLSVRGASLEAALPAGLRWLEVEKGPFREAGLSGNPPCIPVGLPQLERLVIGSAVWYKTDADEPLDITVLSELRGLTHLELDGPPGLMNGIELITSVPE